MHGREHRILQTCRFDRTRELDVLRCYIEATWYGPWATVAQGALLSAIEMAAVRAFRDDPATAQNMADVMRTITLAAVMALLAGPAVAQRNRSTTSVVRSPAARPLAATSRRFGIAAAA